MSVINWNALDDLLTRRVMNDWGMSEADIYIFSDLIKEGVTVDDLRRHVLSKFPRWSGRINELEAIVEYVTRNY